MTARDDPAGPDDGRALPVLGTPARTQIATGAACDIDDDGCITCGDVAVPLTVVEPGRYDALCRDDAGRTELVATELVGDLSPGDTVLVHAKVALEKLTASGGARPGPDGRRDAHAVR